jgi:hypothetical protein
MNVGYKIKVGWGIRGPKHKWKHLMKRFYATKSKDIVFFTTKIILISFLHDICMDLTYEIIRKQMLDTTNHGWDGDF